MSTGVLCRQHGCSSYAAVRFTWPGREESAVCAEHAVQLSGVASAIGLRLQLVPISVDEHLAGALRSEVGGI